MVSANSTVAIGYNALSAAATQANTVAIGVNALQELTSGAGNIAIGYSAMMVHTTGERNIAIGESAMDDTNAGSTSLGSTDNIFMGYHAGGGTWTDVASNQNVGIGNYAIDAALDGALGNTSVGHYSLSGVSTGGLQCCSRISSRNKRIDWWKQYICR